MKRLLAILILFSGSAFADPRISRCTLFRMYEAKMSSAMPAVVLPELMAPLQDENKLTYPAFVRHYQEGRDFAFSAHKGKCYGKSAEPYTEHIEGSEHELRSAG